MQILNTMQIEASNATAINPKDLDNIPIDGLQAATSSTLLDKENLRVPICPIKIPNDEVLYLDPVRADTFYYLPRYGIVREQVSGVPRYRIEMVAADLGWRLIVFIEPFIADSLIAKSNDATELAHTLTASIRYNKGGRPMIRQFDEIENHGSSKRLSMNLVDIEQRDDMFTALSTHEFSTSLLVQRKIEVAIPVEVQVPITPPRTARMNVILSSIGTNRLAVIKAIRQWTGAGLKKTVAILKQPLPLTLAGGMPKDRANAFAKALNAAGASAKISNSNKSRRPRRRPTPGTKKVNVWLLNVGQKPSHVLAILQKIANIHPRKGKAILHKTMPVEILSSASIELARTLIIELKGAGAQARMKASQRVASAPQFSATRMTKPQLEFLGTEDANIRGTWFTRYYISVKNADEIPRALFSPAPDLPPCGRNTKSSRTWVSISDQNGRRLYGYCALSNPASLSKLSFSLKKGTQAPKSVQIALNDRRTNTIYKSSLAFISKAPKTTTKIKYQLLKHICEQAVAPNPFHFDERLHSYVYKFLGNQGSAQLIRRDIMHNTRLHTYYVDANQRDRVYFFPDEFRIARKDKPPFTPRVSVQINSREDDSGVSDVILSYFAAPVIDSHRLTLAKAELLSDLRSDQTDIDFRPYPVVDYSFNVEHPTASGIGGGIQDVSANVFYQGIHNTLLMELLPFVADFNKLSGKIFDHAVLENDNGAVSLSLINSIESSLDITDLSVELERNGNTTATQLTSTPDLPCLLPPGKNVALELIPETILEGSKPLKALLNTSNIELVLDDDAVFEAIINRSTTEYFRMITVRVVEQLFDTIDGREGERIVELVVHVEGSQGVQSVVLSVDNREASARVDYSVDNLIKRDETSIAYRYWFQVGRADLSTENFEGGEATDQLLLLDLSRVMDGGRE